MQQEKILEESNSICYREKNETISSEESFPITKYALNPKQQINEHGI